jgi:hypothetical protein
VSAVSQSPPRTEVPRSGRWEVLAVAGSIALAASVVALPWFSLAHTPTRMTGDGFVCGAGRFSCTAFETFPLMRWLLLAIALVPLVSAYVLARGPRGGLPLGEITAMAGSLGAVLILYNGIIDRPGVGVEEAGIAIGYGYAIALAGTIAIAVAGVVRVSDTGAQRARRPPGVL